MEIIVDLHVHGRYARATSSRLNPRTMRKAAIQKGVNVLGTGDFTHPEWFREFKELEERDGLLFLEEFPFMLSVEVNNVFEYRGRVLTIHNVIITDSLESAEQICDYLGKYGDLSKDGRPNINLSMVEMMDSLKSMNPRTEVFAAHIWTPWFSILGARNGLRSIYEVIDSRLLAVETGLSADPEMTWKTHAGDFPIISNSDAHSLENIGREATKIEVSDLSYQSIIRSIRERKILKTYEFYPQEGKYYYDGHRNCGVSQHPDESISNLNICKKCGRKLTIGVLHRSMELKDNISRPHQKFQYIIPLKSILSYVMGVEESSKRVEREYERIIKVYGTEMNVFDSYSREILVSLFGSEMGNKMYRILSGGIDWEPGYDGLYGRFRLKEQNLLEQLK
ncbi:MAG: endonuclease Q family protein [Candidatus Micrarchaeota archaeon]|nr:endonuclease Q family protein [Candidatus Micrarchaeota archaeon]MCX8154661.1 endonuclease Q family protein [Candidatus Micrarchaeota archaeon]